MSSIRTRAALSGVALVLAAGGATGGAILTGDATAASAKQAKPCKAKKKGVRALNQTIRGAIKDAKGGDRKALSADQLREAVAPAVAKAVQDGTVPQKLVDRRAERLGALSAALGG